jgi:hypothetical protein
MRIARICARQRGVIAGWQLERAGLSGRAIRKRVDAERLHVVYRRVYALSPVLTPDGHRAAAILASGTARTARDIVLGVWSAAELLGIAANVTKQHHTISPHNGTRGQPGLVVHRTRGLQQQDVVRVRWLRTTTAGRALLDCAADGLVDRPLERAVAEAQYLKLIDAHSLEATLRRNRGHPALPLLGAVDLGAARRRRTESPLEEDVRERLALLPIPEPECQYRIRGLSGAWYRADFAWERQRVILEADGRDAHARALTLDDDRARDNDVMATSWWVMRVTRRQVRTTWPTFAAQLIARLSRPSS